MDAVLEQQAADKPPAPKAKKTKPRQPASQAHGHDPFRVFPSTRAARATASTAPSPDPSTTQSATTALQNTAPEAPSAPAVATDVPTQPTPSITDPAVLAGLNRQVSILENNLFASHMLAGMSVDGTASVTSVRLLFAHFRQEAGGSTDPVEKVLLDQLLAAHIKVAELYALAARATNIEFVRAYQNAAARLLGMLCQLVATLSAYRSSRRPRRRKLGRNEKGDTQVGSKGNEKDA
jgi:hypothetical protein